MGAGNLRRFYQAVRGGRAWLKLMHISEHLASVAVWTWKLEATECLFKSFYLWLCQDRMSICARLSNVQDRLTSAVYSQSSILGSDLIGKQTWIIHAAFMRIISESDRWRWDYGTHSSFLLPAHLPVGLQEWKPKFIFSTKLSILRSCFFFFFLADLDSSQSVKIIQ